MVQAIVYDEEGIGIKCIKRIKIAAETTEQAYLTKLVTKNTLNALSCFDIAAGFLDADPNTWDTKDDYKIAGFCCKWLEGCQ